VQRQVLHLQEQEGPEIDHQACYDEEQSSEEISHLAHGIGQGHDARADHCLHNSRHCEHKVWLEVRLLALVVSNALANTLCSPFSSPLSSLGWRFESS
jgi:hypothetical protein